MLIKSLGTISLILGMLAQPIYAKSRCQPMPSIPDLPSISDPRPATAVLYKLPNRPVTLVMANGNIVTAAHDPRLEQNAIASALRILGDNAVLELFGPEFNGLTIGGNNPHRADYVYRPDGSVIRGITIRTNRMYLQQRGRAKINGIALMGDIRRNGLMGTDGVTIENVDLVAVNNNSAAFITGNNGAHGLVRIRNVDFIPGTPGAYGGYGMKWGFRGYRMCLQVENARLRHISPVGPNGLSGAQEHFFYNDSLGYMNDEPNYIGRECISFFSNVSHQLGAKTGRTSNQLVNRSMQSESGHGTVVYQDYHAITEAGGGGSGITVAGHQGRIIMNRVRVDTNIGAVAIWADEGVNHGAYYDRNMHTTGEVVIKDLMVNALQSDRQHVLLTGMKRAFIKNFRVNGNDVGFDIAHQSNILAATGPVHFYQNIPQLSNYPGFGQSLSHKMRRDGVFLLNSEIDQLNCR